ncbi:RhoGAP-domain-containing protein, partial [Rhizodiscina lignyota]
MPNGVQTGAARPPGEPQPAPINTQTGDRESRKELHSWWRQFRHRGTRREAEQKIFGVALQESIRYANVAISLYDAEGNSYIYGYVPIVVAKCGVFLKEKATEVEGIFRLSGSEKRIKELRAAFNSPPRYGKGLNWEGYTVHDAANILRRYFNQLPEPIVPLEFYERFRLPLKGHQQQAVGPIDGQAPSVGEFNMEKAIVTYQNLITELPPLNRQLLLYILDLLAVFASKSDLNKMTTPNLAAIFQPGLISHPNHDMAPGEYRLSQDVLIFLIENQDHF